LSFPSRLFALLLETSLKVIEYGAHAAHMVIDPFLPLCREIDLVALQQGTFTRNQTCQMSGYIEGRRAFHQKTTKQMTPQEDVDLARKVLVGDAINCAR
jgi:hypothetical protein